MFLHAARCRWRRGAGAALPTFPHLLRRPKARLVPVQREPVEHKLAGLSEASTRGQGGAHKVTALLGGWRLLLRACVDASE